MLRFLRIKLSPLHSCSTQQLYTPYLKVYRAVETKGAEGLLGAFEVFQQFKAFLQKISTPRSSSNSSATLLEGLNPIRSFCGKDADVEPFTVLMMKVLCDLEKMEDLRFLFALRLNECNAATPLSIDLFNVYLAAMSVSDAFNAHEVDNVERVLDSADLELDIVTELSFLLLHIRLGRTSMVDTEWPRLEAKIQTIIAENRIDEYPLLELRLVHCFQIFSRVHYHWKVAYSAFSLVQKASPERLTSQILVPYMLLTIGDQAIPPSVTVEVLKDLELKGNAGQSTTPYEESPNLLFVSTSAKNEETRPVTASREAALPPLYNEGTLFRLLAKCALAGDCTSFDYLVKYIERCASNGSCRIIQSENEAVLALLQLQAYARGGQIIRAFEFVESVSPAIKDAFEPIDRPKIKLKDDRRMTLSSFDPATDLIAAIASGGTEGIVRLMCTLGIEGTEKAAVGNPLLDHAPSPFRPSAASLQFLMAAAARLGEYRLTEVLLTEHGRLAKTPTGLGLSSYVMSALPHHPLLAVDRARKAVCYLTPPSDSLPQELVRSDDSAGRRLRWAAMEAALSVGDVEVALDFLLHVFTPSSLEIRQGSRLVQLAVGSDDHELISRVFEALLLTRTPLETPTFATLKRLGFQKNG